MLSKKNKWTGERLETFVSNESMIEHLHRYALAKDFVGDLVVLDIASGEGYGSYLLSKEAKKVFGVDIDDTTIEKAKKKYTSPNLTFLQGSTSSIPLKNNSIDVVISFETIEHHDEHELMIKEIKRVLKPKGILIISTPDKAQYSDIPKYQNPFHVKELYEQEFKDLIIKNFNYQVFMKQQPIYGSVIINEKSNNDKWTSFKGNYQNINASMFESGMYIIAIASDASLHNLSLSNSFWTDKNLIFTNIVEEIKSSIRYKLGHTILTPFSWLLQTFRKWKK